jgi:hypothetical protein
VEALWHTHDKTLNQLTRYTPPTLLQGLHKPLPLLLSLAEVLVLWRVLVHALLRGPPKVLNWVEVGGVGRPIYRVDVVLLKERSDNVRAMYARPILLEQLRTPPMRQESFCQGLNVTLGAIATA